MAGKQDDTPTKSALETFASFLNAQQAAAAAPISGTFPVNKKMKKYY